MRTALAATAALLAVAATGCGKAEPVAAPVQALANAMTGVPATSPDLLQCLVQSGVEVWGTDQRTTGTPADYVEAETSTLTLADGLAKLWVFADAGTAERYAEYGFESDVRMDFESTDATYSVHGNVALTSEHPGSDARVLDCLPGAANPIAVLPPAPGTVSFGSFLACLRTTEVHAQGSANTAEDQRTHTVGTLGVRTEDLDSVAYVEIHADVAWATKREKFKRVRFGNVLVTFDEDLERTSAPVQALVGCLPTASAAAPNLTTATTTTPEDLLTCIEAIGYQPSPPVEQQPYGVSVPVQRLDVYGMKGSVSGQLDQAAYLYLFPDAATAAADAEWLVEEDADPAGNQYGVHGNVVRAFNAPLAATPNSEEQAVLDCLPPRA